MPDKKEAKKVGVCSKCGRPLKSPESIALGMGPTCAGAAPKGSKRVARIKGSAKGSYTAFSASVGNALPSSGGEQGKDKKKTAKERRAAAHEIIVARTDAFYGRKPFWVNGSLSPIEFIPADNGGWKTSIGENTQTSERMEAWLVRYGLIYKRDYKRDEK